MENTIIRYAKKEDVPKINEILNYSILHTNYNLNENKRPLLEAYKWFDEHLENNYPVLVSETNGIVSGFASLSKFRNFSGYDPTAELSIYVSNKHQRKGIGIKLIKELELISKNYHTLISVITSNNIASLSLHKKCGFKEIATFKELAQKNNTFVDITFMTKNIK